MRTILKGTAALLLVLLVGSGAFAQVPTGTILGVVKDSSGAVVPDTTVTIRNVDTAATRTATTGDDGAFRVPALPVGHYTVRFEKTGFNSETQTSLTLEVGQDLVVNSTLQVGTSTQEVTVTGEAPVVNTTNGALGGVVNEEKMADLPLNGRNWVDLTLMQPGVEQHRNVGGGSPIPVAGTFFSANGAPIRSNNYTLDGTIMQTIYGATVASVNGSSIGVDGIREFKVQTNYFSAEYGLTMGSQVALVSKSGTNQFHGAAFEYLRNSVLDARNVFDSAASSNGKRLPEFQRNDFGASVGGPIIKDKLFFFLVFEGDQERKGLTPVGNTFGESNAGVPLAGNCRTATNNPCATGTFGGITPGNVSPVTFPFLALFPLPTPGLNANQYSYPFTRPVSEQYGQARFDYTFSDKDQAFARYNTDYTILNQPVAANPNPNTFDNLLSESQFMSLVENHIFSPTLLNTARFSVSETPIRDWNNTPAYPCASGPCSFIPGVPSYGDGTVSVTGITSFAPGSQLDHFQRILAWSDDAFYTHGRHAIKFGTLITHYYQKVVNNNSNRGTIAFSSLANLLDGNYTSYNAFTPGSNARRDYTSGTLGFYIQDDIRVSSRLTVNAGLRYEILAPNFKEINGLGAALRNIATDANTTPGQPILNPSLKAFSPRLGFAWDIFGDGKTSLRGGAAILYDIGDIGSMLNQAAGGTPVGPASNGLGTTISTVTAKNATVNCPAPALTIPLTFPSCWVGNTLNLIDYNLGQPHMAAYNLTIERQLPFGVGLAVGYAGSRGWDIYNRTEGNPCVPESITNGVSNWANFAGVNGAPLACPPVGTQVGQFSTGRRNPNWASMNEGCSCSQSWYNSLQIVATKRVSKGLQFQANYTWSKNIDEGSGQIPSDNATAVNDPYNLGANRAPAAFDIPQNFRMNIIYSVPKVAAGGFEGGVLNGWRLSGIISVQNGEPFTPLLGFNRSLSGVLGSQADRPDIVPGRSINSIENGVSTANGIQNTCPTAGQPLHTPSLWFDPCGFYVQPLEGYLGTSGRDILRAPGLSDIDFSIVKDTPIRRLGEAGQLEFRAEIFNLFNHANFGVPAVAVYTGNSTGTTNALQMTNAAAEVPTASAGQITTTTTTSRQIQLALRLSF